MPCDSAGIISGDNAKDRKSMVVNASLQDVSQFNLNEEVMPLRAGHARSKGFSFLNE
jgi:hypothetical protein